MDFHPKTMSPVRIGDIDDDHVHRLEVKTSALDPLVIYNNNYLTLGHVTAREYLLHTERYDHVKFLTNRFLPGECRPWHNDVWQ